MTDNNRTRLTRREVIRGTGAVTIASLVTPAPGMKAATTPFEDGTASRDTAPWGSEFAVSSTL
jgi:hypothetical protein